jgi:hypothetical protein
LIVTPGPAWDQEVRVPLQVQQLLEMACGVVLVADIYYARETAKTAMHCFDKTRVGILLLHEGDGGEVWERVTAGQAVEVGLDKVQRCRRLLILLQSRCG